MAYSDFSLGNAQQDFLIVTLSAHAAANLTDAFFSNGKKGTSLVRPLVVVNALGVELVTHVVFVTNTTKHA